MRTRAQGLMRRLATGSAKLQRELSTAKLRMDGVRLGNVGYHRHGAMGASFMPIDASLETDERVFVYGLLYK